MGNVCKTYLYDVMGLSTVFDLESGISTESPLFKLKCHEYVKCNKENFCPIGVNGLGASCWVFAENAVNMPDLCNKCDRCNFKKLKSLA